MTEQSLLEMMRQMEKEMPLSWHIKMVPYKIWAAWYVFFHISLPNFGYIVKEFFCRHEFKSVESVVYKGNYVLICDKCGKLK